jgi:hypothetical protein
MYTEFEGEEVPVVHIFRDDGAVLITLQEKHDLILEFNPDSYSFNVLRFLANDRTLPKLDNAHPFANAITTLRKAFKDDPKNPSIITDFLNHKGRKYRLHADVLVIAGTESQEETVKATPFRQVKARYVPLKSKEPAKKPIHQAVEEEPWVRTPAEVSVSLALLEIYKPGRELYYEDLQEALAFLPRTLELEAGGMSVRVIPAAEMGSVLMDVVKSLQDERFYPSVIRRWTEEERNLWDKTQELQKKTKSKSINVMLDHIARKIQTSERDFYKRHHSYTGLNTQSQPSIRIK